jgi:hypothetical protein
MEQSDLYLLQTVPPYHLQAIVKTRLAALSPAGKPLDLTALSLPEQAEYLFEPRACREALRTLSEPETSVLRELVACGGRANSRDLALYFDFMGPPFAAPPTLPSEKDSNSVIQSTPSLFAVRQTGMLAAPSLYPAPHPHGVFEQALHHLLVLGLLFWGKQTNFVGRDYANGVYDGVLIVPSTVIEIASQEWDLNNEQLPPVVQKDERPGEGIHTFQRALYLYWSLVAGSRDGLPLVSSHLLSRAALRQVIEQLALSGKFLQKLSAEQIHIESDAPPLLFLRLLLMKLGLLVERQGALHAAPAKDFFALPLGERAWRCFRLWLETAFWNEFVFLPDVVMRPGPSPLETAHEEMVRSRQLIVEHFWRVAPETWHSLPGFVARMKLHANYLLFPRQYGSRAERYSVGSNPYGWDFRLRRGWLTHREGWHLVEGGFIRTMLTGPLLWLGAIELEGAEHPDAFRLAQGASLLASATVPEVADPPWGHLVVQPNFDLVALAPVAESLLIELDRFAERVGLEHIAQYHLSKASVTRAVQQGLTAEAIQQILARAAGDTLPQNVHYSLLEWERQARRIELWRAATLLEVDDPTLLDELAADPEMGAWFVRRFSPTLVEVAPQHLVRLREQLWLRDYLPAMASASQHQDLLNGAPMPTREAQWTLLPDGLLRPCYLLPNLFLATELERITESDEATGWRRITPASLQQALASGLELGRIIKFLQNYCDGGLPGSFLIRLKLWGQGYAEHPSLQVETAPLLSLSAQALQDLLADEEIGPLLDTPVPPEKRLIRVSQENLTKIVELLKDRGFEVF